MKMPQRVRLASRGALPTFFIIGAARAGTTSLHYYLSLHPEIQMSAVKEPHFFAGPAGEFPFGTPRIERLEDYRALFDPRAAVRGEASPSYSAFPRRMGVPGRIHDLVPDARFIYLVRDPIDRTLSHYRHRVAVEGERRSLADAIGTFEPSNIYLCASRYASQLEQYLACFAAISILIVRQEELLASRIATLRRIFAFLGVGTDFVSPGFATQYRGSEAGKQYPGWYRAALRLSANTPLARLPMSARQRLRLMFDGAVLQGIPEISLDKELRDRLACHLGPEAERFRKITGLDTVAWSL